MSNKIQTFSIGTVARIVGVSTHVLRAWEKRYGLKLATRSEKGRRQYGPNEVEKLRLIKGALDVGYKISDIANMSATQLTQLQKPKFNNQPVTSPQKKQFIVYGNHLSHLLFQSRQNIRYQVVENLFELPSIAERLASFVQGVLLEFNQIDNEIEELLYTTKLSFKYGEKIVVFTTTPVEQERLQRLSQSQVEIIQGELDQRVLADYVQSQHMSRFQRKQPDESRELTSQQTNTLLSHQSEIYCACPQHLADLYSKLDKFVKYSNQCERISPKDSAVHQHLSHRLIKIRSQLSSLIFDVAEIDGIDL